mgnify:CR=1 FL=1
MKLSLAVTPLEPSQLQLTAQLGVQGITYYNMQGMPMTFRELSEAQSVAQDHGVSIAVVEGSPPINHCVFGRPARDRELPTIRAPYRPWGKAEFPRSATTSCPKLQRMPWSSGRIGIGKSAAAPGLRATPRQSSMRPYKRLPLPKFTLSALQVFQNLHAVVQEIRVGQGCLPVTG